MIFTSVIGLGQVIFSLGLSIKSWPVVFVGRLVFGFGAESLIVANSALLADWFRGRELALAFGINLSIARLGSVTTNLVSPILTQDTGIVFASWFGVIMCAISVLSVVITMPIDRHMEKKTQLKHHLLSQFDDDDNKQRLIHNNSDEKPPPTDPEHKTQFRDVFKFTIIFWILCISCIAIYGASAALLASLLIRVCFSDFMYIHCNFF